MKDVLVGYEIMSSGITKTDSARKVPVSGESGVCRSRGSRKPSAGEQDAMRET